MMQFQRLFQLVVSDAANATKEPVRVYERPGGLSKSPVLLSGLVVLLLVVVVGALIARFVF